MKVNNAISTYKKIVVAKNTNTILNVSNVSKSFGHIKVLKNVSFTIEKNDVIALIGANGSGKTTLSEIIAGLTKPDSGKIKYNFSYEETPKEKIGMQFQQSNYPSGLTIKDMVHFSINLRNVVLDKDELNELLEIFELKDIYKHKVSALSGGQKQKLNIFMSMIHKPKILILDEISTGLDISARENIIAFIKRLLKKVSMSVILISHHMDEIKALCKKIISLKNGKVYDISSISAIEKKHKSLSNYVKTLIIN